MQYFSLCRNVYTMLINLADISADKLSNGALCKWKTYPNCIGMWVAEMDFGTPDIVRKCLHNLIDEGSIGYVSDYCKNHTAKAIAKWYKENYNFNFSADDVLLVTDVMMAFRACLLAWTKEHDKIVVPTPAYPPFIEIPPTLKREVVEVKSLPKHGRIALDLEGIEEAFLHGARTLVLCNPWNPTGRVFSEEELLQVAEICSRFKAKVFVDEIHAPLVFTGKHIPFASLSRPACDYAVTAFSASKGWNIAGSHCAALIIPRKEAAKIMDSINALGAKPSVLGTHALFTCLTEAECAQWLEEAKAVIADNYLTLKRWAKKHGDISIEKMEGTYIAWINFSRLVNKKGEKICTLGEPANLLLDKAQVALTPGKNCGKGYSNYARLILATTPEILQEALNRIDKFLAGAC